MLPCARSARRTSSEPPNSSLELFFAGGGEESIPTDEQAGFIRALDPLTGEKRWEFRTKRPPWSGVMSTGGGLVFAGTPEGYFFALDAASGKPLWDFQAGDSVTGNPISFDIHGHQHVAVAASRVLYVFGL